MVMDKYYHQDRSHELWNQINSLHLSYLEMEESPQKLEHRNKLEDCINNYLCIVPHNQKFEFQETALVLFRSASSKNDFSGYKAALGWDAIGRYAANLITQPWRREYRQIKMYSGFYKHEIESNLVGAEIMFELMGYTQIGDEMLILDGPICPDRATSVSLDSLIAYVECQILKAIWEEVSSYNISWLDVLKFRESHLCTPKQSISSLIYMHQQRQYQDKMHNYSQMDVIAPMKMINHNVHPMYSMQLPCHAQHMAPPPCMHTLNGCCGNYMAYNPHQYNPYMGAINYTPAKATHSYPPPPYKYTTVPTAQLIELDQHTYDVPDSSANHRYDHVYEETERKLKNSYISDKKIPNNEPKLSDRDDGSGTFESWDYVYRNLESQGYCKDLGERGDILSQPLQTPEERSKRLSSKPYKTEMSKEKKKPESPQNNLYDNVPPNKLTPQKVSGTMKVEKKIPSTNGASVKKSKEPADSKSWNCCACTFLNSSAKDICEICGKSKNLPKSSDEIEIGGAECVKCTFVNSKDKKICVVCGASLNNSPTYI